MGMMEGRRVKIQNLIPHHHHHRRRRRAVVPNLIAKWNTMQMMNIQHL